MAILELESLLAPISEDAPCGPNLEYDVVYASFEQASKGKPEQQYGSTIIPAEDPNWTEVRRHGMELIERSKDLRVSCLLAQALIESDGFTGFAEALALTHGYLERYWPTVHPQLDPEDDNDPTLRVNTISSLSDQSTTVRALRIAPMVASRVLGKFTLRDLEVATGETPPGLNEEAPKLSSIEAAFMECELDQLRENTAAVASALEHAEAIESIVTEQVGASRAIGLEKLRETLKAIHTVLSSKLAQRDVAGEEAPAGDDGAAPLPGEAGQAAAPRLTGEIRSRDDAVLALEKVCQYYLRHEPSSPLPILLNRAKRLANKNFMEIVKDLSPDALAQIQSLAGAESSEEGDS